MLSNNTTPSIKEIIIPTQPHTHKRLPLATACLALPLLLLGSTQAQEPATKTAPFPGFVSEDFVFTEVPFPECHASTLCETSKGLVAAWFGGTEERNKDVGIWVSHHEDGKWSAPKEVADGVQSPDLRHPCWNPVLYQTPNDGPTLLFFKVGPKPSAWWGELIVSHDQGRTFADQQRLPKTFDGPVRCKPVLLEDGETLLCGSSTEHDGWRVHFERAKLVDGVPTNWERIGPIGHGEEGDEFDAIQPSFLRHADGRIEALCRTKQKVVGSSTSKDQGKSWSTLTATSLPNANSGVEVVTLKDGRHLLIYNHQRSDRDKWGRRGLLNLAISDNGKTWRKVGILEQKEHKEYSYPAIIQSNDGLVHMTYTWERSRIKHVVVDPKKIEPGDVLTHEPW